MRTFLFASAAVLLSGSLGNADNPGLPNDNDHLAALGFAIERNAIASTNRYGARIVTATGGGVMTSTTAAGQVSPGFLLHTSDNDQKRVENQYPR